MKLRTRKRADGEEAFFIDYQESGQRRRVSLEFITRADAKRLFNTTPRELAKQAFYSFKGKRARGEQGLPVEPGLTIAGALDNLTERRRATVSPAHLKNLETISGQLKDYFGAAFPARTLTAKAAYRFIQDRKEQGDAPPTIARKVAFLKAAVGLAIREGLIGGANALEDVELPSDRREPGWRWLREEEIEALLSVLRGGARVKIEAGPGKRQRKDYEAKIPPKPRLYELSVFLLNSGARRGEALALRWRDVDFARGLVRLLGTKRAAKGRPAAARYIPMNAALRELLADMGPGKAGDQVFTVSRHNLIQRFQRACELAGIGHCRIHDLRHTFASHLAINGTPLAVIRELLGHASLSMTLRYSHLCPEVKADAVGRLNFGGPDQGARIVTVGAVEDGR